MAEPVYKKITELDVLSGALDGNETLPLVKAGKTYRRTWMNLFGTGWISWLLGAFSAFKAPDANHADDADTVGGESTAQLHAAGSLTGALNLAVIPAELTGKNAATATTSAACSGNAATATTAASCSGNAATATYAASAGNASFASSSGTSHSCSGNSETASRASISDRVLFGSDIPKSPIDGLFAVTDGYLYISWSSHWHRISIVG